VERLKKFLANSDKVIGFFLGFCFGAFLIAFSYWVSLFP